MKPKKNNKSEENNQRAYEKFRKTLFILNLYATNTLVKILIINTPKIIKRNYVNANLLLCLDIKQ